jgi:signal transduction histidine kinase
VQSGLRYQSWLLEVDGEMVERASDVAAKVSGEGAGKGVGEIARYTLEKNGERYSIDTPITTLAPRAWASVYGIYLFDALVLLVLGVVVIYLKPADSAARAMFYFSVTLACYLATSADLFGPYWFRMPYFFFVNLIPASVAGVLSHFPVGRTRSSREPFLLGALAAAGVALAVASNLSFHRNRDLLLVFDRTTHVLLAGAGLAAIVFFWRHFLRAPSALVRARTMVVLFGTLGAFAAPVIVLSLMYLLGVPFALNWATLTFVFFPLSIGYAIARHDLFDIDRIIRRTLTYAVLSALVFGTYSLGIGIVDYFFENLTQLGSRIAEGLLILALILLTSPSRDRIQDFVDRIYDRHRYSYRDVVRSSSRAFATILDFEKLISRALSLVDDTLQPSTAAIYTVAIDGTATLRGHLEHPPGEGVKVTVSAGGERAIDLSPLLSALDKAPMVGDGIAGFAAPMKLEGKPVGVLVGGAKRSGTPYTQDDYDLVYTVCDQLAVALQNAQAYRTIDVLNADLAGKNVALEGANRELREAQDELVRRERLAAVGELAGAVAHAMRNPLAGIKAAAQLAALDLEGHPSSESLADVIGEANRLDDRIGALLQFSRPFEPLLRSTEMSHVVAGAVRDMAARAAARRVEIRTMVAPDLPTAELDPVLIEQAILELLSNAVDASTDGGKVVVRASRVTNGSTGAQDSVAVEVLDSGSGINERSASRLFELFYTTKARGTGFGLASVKKIVDRHGGLVEAGNRPEGGALFRIVLPVAPNQRSPNLSSR